MLARLGLHWGAVANARVNMTPDAASASRCGLVTVSTP
jgi:hypothetical protein